MSKADAGLRALLKTHLPDFDFTAIESGGTSRGIPDTHFCCRGVTGWVECKSADHQRIHIRAEQVGWIERRLDHGDRVFVAVRRDTWELWLYHGYAARDLIGKRLEEVPRLGRWNGGPASWMWNEISRILLTGK